MRRKATTTEMMKGYITDALFLLMAQKPFTEITIGEIADKAGVNRSTYYRNFASKEDILASFLDEMMQNYIASIQIAGILERRQYFEKMFQFYSDFRKKLLLLYDNGLSFLLLSVLNRYLGTAENPNVAVSEQYAAAYHIGGVFNCFLFWFSRRMKDTPTEMAEMVMSVIPANVEPVLLKRQTIYVTKYPG